MNHISAFDGCSCTLGASSISAAGLVSGLLLAFLVGATSVEMSGEVGGEVLSDASTGEAS